MLASNLQLNLERVAEVCKRWKITELAVFGSALRDDFRPDSDVDFLLTFEADASPDFEDWPVMESEFKEMLGHRVDLVERRLVEQSENYIRRGEILRTAERVYASR